MKNTNFQIKYIVIGLFCFLTSLNRGSAQVYPGFENTSNFHHQKLERRRVELAPGVYAFIGYGLSNIGVIASKNGYILIDAGSHPAVSMEALKEIRQLVADSLQAIILTHSHGDHRGGANAFLGDRQGKVPVYASFNFEAEQRAAKGLEKVTSQRTAKQFGQGIPDDMYIPNIIIPNFPGVKMGPLVTPNHFVEEGKTELTIDGVKLELYTLPSETPDHLAIWLPDKKVLFSGDAVYGSFQNVYPLRGGEYRDMEKWAATIHRLMEFKPDAIMFGHTDAIVGTDKIQSMLSSNAEAIEYVYSETIKGMNEGKTPDELAANIQLPMNLRQESYLGEYYGAISWAVREIYAAKLGWFDGNATNLVPLTPTEEAERMAGLAGGKEHILQAAKDALKKKDFRWAAKLADWMLLLGEEKEGRRIKADALEGISHNILPIAGKNYLIRTTIDLKKGL